MTKEGVEIMKDDKDETKYRIKRALKEVELIEKGVIPRRSAREFLDQLRGRINDEK